MLALSVRRPHLGRHDACQPAPPVVASIAYVLLCALRRIGLAHSQFADATCGTIRLKLLKIGALVRVSVRRIKVAMSSACP
jgi:Transposase DDE domain group 1